MREWSRLFAGVWLWIGLAAPAPGAELYLRGDIGVSFGDAEADGFNQSLAVTNSGSGDDSSPVYGGALGIQFAMNEALPWRWRTPRLRIPYWPGRALELGGSEETGFPAWPVSFEVEHLRGRNLDLVTGSFTPLDPYRSEVDSWSVMSKLRLDLPVRPVVQNVIGRVPFLDPMSVYLGGGAGLGVSEIEAGQATTFGSDERQEFAWQAVAGIGYQLNDWVRVSLGWRYYDLGSASTDLRDAAGIERGSYSVDLRAHEFATSLSFSLWRLPSLGRD